MSHMEIERQVRTWGFATPQEAKDGCSVESNGVQEKMGWMVAAAKDPEKPR